MCHHVLILEKLIDKGKVSNADIMQAHKEVLKETEIKKETDEFLEEFDTFLSKLEEIFKQQLKTKEYKNMSNNPGTVN